VQRFNSLKVNDTIRFENLTAKATNSSFHRCEIIANAKTTATTYADISITTTVTFMEDYRNLISAVQNELVNVTGIITDSGKEQSIKCTNGQITTKKEIIMKDAFENSIKVALKGSHHCLHIELMRSSSNSR
jgi:hypothetical protein